MTVNQAKTAVVHPDFIILGSTTFFIYHCFGNDDCLGSIIAGKNELRRLQFRCCVSSKLLLSNPYGQ
jgi:hypothetical protein